MDSDIIECVRGSNWYEQNLLRLKQQYHSRCLFNKRLLIDNLSFRFRDDGKIIGSFSGGNNHEGYDGIAHGGIIAAIIDASMAQCLMGHGITGYTGELTVRYRGPVRLNTATSIITGLVDGRYNKLYSMESTVMQDDKTCATAKATFFKFNQ
jgi:acyl-coenzyme A thioesterase PaaI-like protein